MRTNPSTSVSVRFFRQLAWLLESGSILQEAYAAMQEAAADDAMKRLLAELGAPEGQSIAKWLANAPDRFPTAIIAAVRDAEAEGKAAQCLDALASDLFRVDALEDGSRSILFYPAAILMVMTLIGGVYTIFVLPAIRNMFESMSAELPGITRLALTLDYWLIVPLVLVSLLIFSSSALSNFTGPASRLHRLGSELTQQLLALMGYRKYRAQLVWARIFRIASVSIQHGLTPATMLRAAASTTLDLAEAAQLTQTARLLDGNDVQAALLAMPKLPHFIREMIVIGHRTQRIEEALAFAGDMARELAQGRIAVARQRFEVTAAIVMGLFVGFMVIAMYLPIFKMGQAVS